MTILAVDDKKEILEKLIRELRNEYPGSEVIGFQDPMMAVRYGYENPIDIVFTASDMQRLSGFSVARLLRNKHGPTLSVILLTDSEQWERLKTGLHINGWMKRSADAGQIREALEHGCVT